jgi:nucleoside-diphosphate-sugar epimerase
MKRSALVTGVTGFIGGKLADRLVADGWAVHAVLRPSSDFDERSGVQPHVHDGSLGSLTEIVRQAAPDVTFHLASLYLAEHQPEQVDDLVASNILFPAQLAEAMTAAGATRLINTGTAWQHFRTADYNPVNLYAATKQACLDLLRYYHDARQLSVVTLKLFDTYGAGDKRRKIVQALLEAAESGTSLQMSPGEQILDLTHVDDVIEAFIAAAEHLSQSEGALFEDYLVSGERFSLRELAGQIAAIAERPIDVEFGARPYRAREVMLPVEPGSGTSLPGWRPRRRLHEALGS